MLQILAVKGIIEESGKYLLAQHNVKNPENKGQWTFLGGWREPFDSSFAHTLKRELQEEVALEIEVFNSVGTYQYKDRIYLVMGARPLGLPSIASEEILTIDWFQYEAIEDLNKKGLLQTGFEIPALKDYINLK